MRHVGGEWEVSYRGGSATPPSSLEFHLLGVLRDSDDALLQRVDFDSEGSLFAAYTDSEEDARSVLELADEYLRTQSD